MRWVYTMRIFLLVSLCTACARPPVSDSDSDSEAQVPPSIFSPSASSTTPVTQSSSAIINEYKPLILRRLSILLTQKLPTIDAVARYQAGTDTLATLIRNALLQSAPGLAQEHRFAWNLLQAATPDLDIFALSDPTLAAQLTQDLQWKITESPLQEIRYILEQASAFDVFLSRTWTLESTNALSLWGETGVSTPWPAEAFQLLTIPSNLGATGLFASNSFAASLNSEQRPIPYGAFAETWRRILCQNFTVADTHEYSQIAEPLTQDWRNVAATNVACAGCHQQYQPAANTLSRQYTGTTLAEWLTINGAAATAGNFAGTAYSDTAALMTIFQQDPRPHLCEMQNLISILLQKPFTSQEQALLARISSLYFLGGHQLSVALQELVFSNAWNPYLQKNIATSTTTATTTTTTTTPSLSTFTPVVHMLTRAQLTGILPQLSTTLTSVSIPYELNPGSDEYESSPHFTPSSTYFYYLDRTMRLAADAVITTELADTSTASTRTLFTKLPDGNGGTADATIITAQILQLWNQLTARTLLTTDMQYTDLYSLWSSGYAARNADPEATREAWRLVLIGILLSREFITY